jgi:uncharacterized protein YxeA
MKKILHILLAFAFVAISTVQAQKVEFTDHKPQYRKWQDSYIIDKIEYTADRTIFYFRFVHVYNAGSGITTEAVFYPKDGEYSWYLKGVSKNENFELIEIRDVRQNGKLLAAKVDGELRSMAAEGISTVFTCQVHFQRLSEEMQLIDFIEGKGKETATNHFNAFDVKIKTAESNDLGTPKDSEARIEEFNKKYNIQSIKEPLIKAE